MAFANLVFMKFTLMNFCGHFMYQILSTFDGKCKKKGGKFCLYLHWKCSFLGTDTRNSCLAALLDDLLYNISPDQSRNEVSMDRSSYMPSCNRWLSSKLACAGQLFLNSSCYTRFYEKVTNLSAAIDRGIGGWSWSPHKAFSIYLIETA